MFIPLDLEYQNKINLSIYGSSMILAIEKENIIIENNNVNGWQTTDVRKTKEIIDTPLIWLNQHKKIKLDRLKEIYAEHFDHHKLANKAETFVHPTSLASHWSTAISNYRKLKTAINNATDAKSVDDIDITTGWPVSL